MRMRKVAMIVGILVAGVLIAPWISTGRVTPSPESANCSLIYRNKYPFRHWVWSGIFPIEGGFISDPQSSCSELVSPPKRVLVLIGDSGAKYQIIEVNPAFCDRTSEVVLVFQTQKKLLEFRLPVPRTEVAIYGTPMYPEARVFPVGKSIAVLTHFSQTKQIFMLPAPLDPEQPVIHFDWKQKEAKSALEAFLLAADDDPDIRQHFCGPPSKPFISFFEKFAGPCSPDREMSGIPFEEFW